MTPTLNQQKDGHTTISPTEPTADTFIVSQKTRVANLKNLTPKQASHVHPMSLEQFTFVSSETDEYANVITQLHQISEAPTTDSRWYPKSETCEEPVESCIYDKNSDWANSRSWTPQWMMSNAERSCNSSVGKTLL